MHEADLADGPCMRLKAWLAKANVHVPNRGYTRTCMQPSMHVAERPEGVYGLPCMRLFVHAADHACGKQYAANSACGPTCNWLKMRAQGLTLKFVACPALCIALWFDSQPLDTYLVG